MPSTQRCGHIAVIDIETTGLFPLCHDRVVEVAAVVLDSDGQVVREFVSLVNPGRDIGPTSIHGLTAEDLHHAPQFNEIAGALVEVMQGTVAVAGHNVRFDQEFLESEFARIDALAPQCFSICTMQLAGGGRLSDCCSQYGIPLSGECHHALADARHTARLLSMLLPDQPRMAQKLSRLMPIQWPTVPNSGRQPLTRDESRRRQSEPPTFLQRLLGRMRSSTDPIATDGAIMAYAALLDRVLEDRTIDVFEGNTLVEMAAK
jgi:DNA polymerase III subunit epsilon